MGEAAVGVEMSVENVSATELKREREIIEPEPEPFPNKKQAKEASCEDVKSEVSNPILSPKDSGSGCQDITSQPTEAPTCWSPVETLTDEVEPSNEHNAEILSNEVGPSSENNALQSLGDEIEPSSENNVSHVEIARDSCSEPSVSTTHVVLEIPKNVSSSGIRKITFKFSKKKEDNDNQTNASVVEPVNNRIDRGYYYNEDYARGYSGWEDSVNHMYDSGERYSCASPNLELKMSKKVVATKLPTNVKKLILTRILDGARVKYIYMPLKCELNGIIEGGGYLCGCSSCDFSRVVTAYEFERHAGARTKHPNNHIYLENGKPIYHIIQESKTAPLSIVGDVIKDIAGSSINEEFFQSWKASLKQSNETLGTRNKISSKLPCLPRMPTRKINLVLNSHYPTQAFEESFYPVTSSFGFSNLARIQMSLAPSKEQKHALKRPSSASSSSGSTKRRDNDLHRLLFMPNGLPDGAELAYYAKGQKLLEGYKQRNGIVCSCCDTEISPSQFESHAGMAARRQPYRHIYTSNGLTLHDIATSLASGQNVTTGISDDMCAKCGNGGELILCRSCPRAFHPGCLDLHCAPNGVWHCPTCNHCGREENFARPIVIRLSRVVNSPEDDFAGCVVCRALDFSTGIFDDRTIILCDQCEREFHVGCLRDSGRCHLKELPKGKWFCRDDCNMTYAALRDSVAAGVQRIPDPLFDIINRKLAEKGSSTEHAASDVNWQILLGKSCQRDHLLLLSAAAAIFRECFDPIVAKSGRDLIPVMVFGRNISGQEFGGMHCVLLTVNSVVVSAGLIRLFGREVAELPLVATSRAHQGKGYFQVLFSCIERLLCSLKVEKLVLPAAEEAESIWIRRFGFRKIPEGEISKYTRELTLTIFKGTSMLEKEVPQMID